MTTHSVTTVFNKKMSFTANISGHPVQMDTTPEHGGDDTGPSPKRLMLASLGGCTGIDVVSILSRMKITFSDFSIDIEAGVRKDYPMIYDKVKITYKIKMAEADRLKMKKAVNLSQEKYCSVSAMFKAFAKIETEIIFLD
jgi:putative redox protein